MARYKKEKKRKERKVVILNNSNRFNSTVFLKKTSIVEKH